MPDDAAFDAARFDTLRRLLPAERLTQHLDSFERLARDTAACAPTDGVLGELAHKLIAQAAMLGWIRLADAARALEQACDTGNGIEPALDILRDRLADLAFRPALG